MTRVRHRIEYAVALAARALVRVLPRRVSLGCGALLGRLFHSLYGARRELAVKNLQLAFPSRSEADCRAILRSAFAHAGRHVIDMLNFETLSPEEMTRLVEVEGGEHVERAMAGGRGVMFFSGHFGYWELQVMAHAARFTPMVLVVRPLDNPLLERLLERVRTRVGTRLVRRRGAVRGLLRALHEKASVGLMIDQHMHDRSAVTVEFFGRPSATTSALAALALRTGAPILPVFTMPLPDGRYRVAYGPPVARPAGDDADPVRTWTQRCTDVLETYVRQHPDLWLWMHRRWRVPAAEPRGAAPAGRPLPAREELPR
ncbi:MAG: lysophospholipid acyltransferase family protein [Acidobacteria bacterium]|nr:lysophospholipid acyltransferase family protein [Acidobacteriota bacterium]